LAAVANNLYLKQSEVHGMSQRGGDVQSHFRLSDKPIASDLVPYGKADLIISVEPMEALRYLPWLSDKGWVVTNSVPMINIPDYPEVDKIIAELKKCKNNIIIDADAIAKEAGSVKASNIVIFGAASAYIDIPFTCIEQAVKTFFEKKGEAIISVNLKALKAGRALSKI
jgi:indolepyruvate ferredoxin oxidoreductase beta subunit